MSNVIDTMREDLRLSFGTFPVDRVTGCPVCKRQESAAHYCPPKEAARQRLRNPDALVAIDALYQEARHVLSKGKLGKQSKRRLKAAVHKVEGA
jgi:hypothetical protein